MLWMWETSQDKELNLDQGGSRGKEERGLNFTDIFESRLFHGLLMGGCGSWKRVVRNDTKCSGLSSWKDGVATCWYGEAGGRSRFVEGKLRDLHVGEVGCSQEVLGEAVKRKAASWVKQKQKTGQLMCLLWFDSCQSTVLTFLRSVGLTGSVLINSEALSRELSKQIMVNTGCKMFHCRVGRKCEKFWSMYFCLILSHF